MSRAHVIKSVSFRNRAKKLGQSGKQKLTHFFKAVERCVKETPISTNLPPGDAVPEMGDLLIPPVGFALPVSQDLLPKSSPICFPTIEMYNNESAQMPPSACETNLPAITTIETMHLIDNQTTDTDDLDALLYSLDDAGLRVSEMKALPSGAMKITVNDLFGEKYEREPEFVRV